MAQAPYLSRCNCDSAEFNGSLSADCAQDICTNAELQVSSCSQLLCLKSGDCNVSLLWTACSQDVCRQLHSTLLKQRKKTTRRPYTVQYLVSELAISFVLSVDPPAKSRKLLRKAVWFVE